MLMATVLQQVEDFRASLHSKQGIKEWTEDLWADVVETEHMAHYLMGDLESLLDASRGKSNGHGAVTLNFRTDHIEITTTMMGRIWMQLKHLEGRILDRVNA